MHVKRGSKSCKPTPIFFRHENLLGSASISRGVRSEVWGGGGKFPRLPPPHGYATDELPRGIAIHTRQCYTRHLYTLHMDAFRLPLGFVDFD